MLKFTGKSVYGGITMGPIVVLKKDDFEIKRIDITDPEGEIARVAAAIESAQAQLGKLYEKAVKDVGEESAAIFEVHQMMLEDEDYVDAIHEAIRSDSINAEYAVSVTGTNFAEMFAAMDDDYMRARAADIKDISDRLVRNLSGRGDMDLASMDPSIIVAEDLTPSETVQMDKEKLLSFVTVQGSSNSHTSILARMMNLPALIQVPMNLAELESGTIAIVDGYAGEVIFDPDENTIAATKVKIEKEKEKQALLAQLKGQKTETRYGRSVKLYANIGGVGDVSYVLDNDAEGIGLFRSEFLYLGRDDYPTEEEQFEAYKAVLEKMEDKKVIIRTMDIGADKKVDYFNLEPEENPALGYRAIRICLTRPDMFKTQLRALLRSAVYGNLAIMYPMIISPWEVEKIYEYVNEAAKELDAKGIAYKIPEQGIMIETPASVMMADELAQLVDFFSIGTNDLTQYTLAIDRQNETLDLFHDSHHPAVLRMIKMVCDSAHKYGKWAGICGELGADLTLTKQFLEMGVDELSVSPSMVLKVRKQVRDL
ncbi:MAG: phosphoenolpyruvate--protein phosphotransferase [Lachnospiraceae bacterium]|nr:phosphoenolpyruvate--protein phosphotransferase [Lachnospiraceae bacterium]